MSERRKQSRVRVELRVEVSGKDASSETFSQSAVATNLSRSGALLSGMAAVLRCGDLLSVKYGERQAEFRIVWVLDSGAQDGFEVAVHRVAESPCAWEGVLGVQDTAGECETSDREDDVRGK